jgi:iron complex transport system substrate-binding protein
MIWLYTVRRFRAAFAWALVFTTACGRTPATQHHVPPLAAVDADGDTVRLDHPARRVVSLVPSATDLIVALGATAQLAGRTRYDQSPAVAAVPSVGGGLDPDMERLAVLSPDLLVAWQGARQTPIWPAVHSRHIPVYTAPIRDTTAFFRTTAGLGTLLGRDSAAHTLTGCVRSAFARVHTSVAGGTTPTVLYLIWGDPPMTVGPHTFIAQLIGVAGGRNAFDDVGTDWPHVSMEEIVHRAPSIILISTGDGSAHGAAQLRTTPGWSALPAVRAGRVTDVPADLSDRPGPQMGAVAQLFRDAIHPEHAHDAPLPSCGATS